MNSGKVGAVFLGVIMVIGVIVGAMCFTKINPGYVGVVYKPSNGIAKETLDQGWHMLAPTDKVTEYSIAIEQGYLSRDDQEGSRGDDSFDIPTSDGKTINVDLEYSYHFNVETITDTFVKFKGQSGNKIETTFIRGKLKAWAGEVSSTFTVIDVFGDKRTELNTAVKNHVASKFAEYGIVIDTINFTRIETDPETAAAIQKKVNAQQELELAQIEAKTAKVQAEKDKEVALIEAEQNKAVALIAAEQNKEKASIEAEQKIIKANADAEALRISSEAEAEANRKIAESLSSELIDKIKYEKWNGTLPTVSGSGATIVDITN